MTVYTYGQANPMAARLAQQLAETERRLAEALKELEALKHPKLPTPHSDGHARLLAATREAFPPRRTRTDSHAR